MPLSDWRDGTDHADAAWGSIYNLDYLTANVAGGEGYDWFYASDLDRDQQRRTPIRDTSDWAEDWIWRYKDIRGWWENDHHDRVGGLRAAQKNGLGAALETHLVHRIWLRRDRPGHEPAQRVSGPEIFRKPRALFFARLARRHDPDAVYPRGAALLGGPGQ